MKTGILITNIGTPDAPTEDAVRTYLKAFLTDPRVVSLPKWLWYPILYGYILRKRPAQSAKLYQSIWTENGSPLLVYTRSLATKLSERLNLPIEVGMHYSNPSIKSGLEKLRALNVKRIIVLPLFPQYSDTTTASTWDIVKACIVHWQSSPEIVTLDHYAEHPDYISTIQKSVEQYTAMTEPLSHLLFSFHGLPEINVKRGDPYQSLCLNTAKGIADALHLTPSQWTVSFQSRLGKAKWLSPYTEKVLTSLPKQGIKKIHVVCPGFSVDCLETLEEIAIRGREQFMDAGGESYIYIPALNDSQAHVDMLANIIQSQPMRPLSPA